MLTRRHQNLKLCLQRIAIVGAESQNFDSNLNYQPSCNRNIWNCQGVRGAASRHEINPFFSSYFQTQKFWQSTIVQEINEYDEFEDDFMSKKRTQNQNNSNPQSGNLVGKIQFCRSWYELFEILENYDEQIDQFLLTQIATQLKKINTKNDLLQTSIINKFIEIQDQFTNENCLVDFLNVVKNFEIRLDNKFLNPVKNLVDLNAENFSAAQSSEIISFFEKTKIYSQSLMLLVQNVISNVDSIDAKELASFIRNCGALKLRYTNYEYSNLENAIIDRLDEFDQLDLVRIFQGMGELKWKKTRSFLDPLNQKIRYFLEKENNYFNPRFAAILLASYGKLQLIQEIDVIQKLSDVILADFENISIFSKVNIFGALNIMRNYQENFMNENCDSKVQILREKISESLISELSKIQPRHVSFILQTFTEKGFLQNYKKDNDDEINSKILQIAMNVAQKNISDYQAGISLYYLQILSKLKNNQIINDEYNDFVDQLVKKLQNSNFVLNTGGAQILRSLDVPDDVIASLTR